MIFRLSRFFLFVTCFQAVFLFHCLGFSETESGIADSVKTSTYSLTDSPEVLAPPVFSSPAGFYLDGFELNITHPDTGVNILYTIDGSIPDTSYLDGATYPFKNQYPMNPGDSFGDTLTGHFQSFIYTGPLLIYDRSGEQDKLVQISSTYDKQPNYFPKEPGRKAFVVRARAVKPGADYSQVVTKTYFVGEQYENAQNLPIISISVQENLLFDYYEGIYVAGVDFDQWRKRFPYFQVYRYAPANYWRRGGEWEYPAYMEYFQPGQKESVYSQPLGIRIHGSSTCTFPLKTLRLYSRSSYGQSRIDFPIFNESSESGFKRVLLRNSGQDFYSTLFRDAAIQKIVGRLNFDTQAYQPVVVFINGEFWGIHNIRERYDKHYLSRVYGIDTDNVDILDGNAVVKEGDNQHYLQMLNFMEDNDLKDSTHYNYIKTQMDIDNYIDYQIAQIFVNNTDWPGNNIDFWRVRTSEYLPDSPYGQDGRWRWLLYDTDFGFRASGHNTLRFATEENGPNWPNPPWSTLIFRKLLTNENFRLKFITRFADLLNTWFQTERMLEIIQQYMQEIEPHIPEHIARWGMPNNLSTWHTYVNEMKDFASERPSWQRQHIMEFFNIHNELEVRLDVNNPEYGFVRINTLDIQPGLPGVLDSIFPWTGLYFEGIPLEIEAIPNDGYVFSHWEGTITDTLVKLEIFPDNALDIQVKAYFKKDDTPAPWLIHYWHFNELPEGNVAFVEADYSLMGSADISYPGTGDGYMDLYQTGSEINLQQGYESGFALRVRNPSDTRELFMEIPSLGFNNISFCLAIHRSTSGPEQLEFYYSVTENTHWIRLGEGYSIFEDNRLICVDLKNIDLIDDNPHLKFKFLFTGENASGMSGNVRIDNVSLHGFPIDGYNLPPTILRQPGLKKGIEQGDIITVATADIFADPNGDSLEFEVSSNRPEIVGVEISDSLIILFPLQRGDAVITLEADDGVNSPIMVNFRMLVYPSAYTFEDDPYLFNYWANTEPDYSYPPHMMFLQSDISDPGSDYPLEYPYVVPYDEYHAEDLVKQGFPYSLTRRSRINALEEGGISFINTGRERDLGGAILAIRTSGLEELELEWTAGTVLQNSRLYGIRLQYRSGTQGGFRDVLIEDNPQEYVAGINGHTIQKGPVKLPGELLDQEYLQLLWRYYFIENDEGSRAELRLDNIRLTADNFLAKEKGEPLQARIYNVKSTLFVDFQDDIYGILNIYSLAGYKVFSTAVLQSGKHSYNTPLKPGFYIVRFEHNQGHVYKRIYVD